MSGGDQRILDVLAEEISALGCPSSTAELKSLYDSWALSNSLEACHEGFKLCLSGAFDGVQPAQAWGQQAAEALNSNSGQTKSVWLAIKVHKTLLKTGIEGIALPFKAAAKETFTLSAYFKAL